MRPRIRAPLHVVHDPVGDDFGVLETVGMMRHTIFDDHRNASAQLLIARLNRQRVPLQQKIGASANIQ